MIATKTTTLVVTMALLGIVPVVAHAQEVVDISELVSQSGTAGQEGTLVTSLEQPQSADNALVDSDTNTVTPINFAIVTVTPGATATVNPGQAFTASDDDTNTAANGATNSAGATQTAAQGQNPSQEQGTTQGPGLTLADVTGLIPGG
jgi:hypothetical protein